MFAQLMTLSIPSKFPKKFAEKGKYNLSLKCNSNTLKLNEKGVFPADLRFVE